MAILSRNEKGEFEEVRYFSPTPEMLILSKLDKLKEELDNISSKLLITEAKSKADMGAMLEELLKEFEKLDPDYECNTYYAAIRDCSNLTQQKIDKLKENINK